MATTLPQQAKQTTVNMFNIFSMDYAPWLVGAKRFIKVFVYAGISAVTAEYMHDPRFFVIGPVLAALEKYLQEKGFF